MWRYSVCLLLAAWTLPALAADPDLAARQAQAQKQQAELRQKIESLRQSIDTRESSRRDAANALRESEQAISDIDRTLAQIEQRQEQLHQQLGVLGKQISEQQAIKEQRQQELVEQLRAQYANGVSPWSALLSGDDPNAINRELHYLGYVSRQQTEQVHQVRRTVERLDRLQAQVAASEKEQEKLATEAAAQKVALEEQKEKRAKVVADISAELERQRSQAANLQSNDKRLGDLISGLEIEIARQAERARRAEEQRRREAARRAEEARKAELARQQEQTAREQARLERERELLERARATQPPLPAALPRSKPEPAEPSQPDAMIPRPPLTYTPPTANERLWSDSLEASSEPSEPISKPVAPKVREVQVVEEPAEQTFAPALEPEGGFQGLKRVLPYPVRGEMQGKFGAERPDGGIWRGVVLRARAGTTVRAVAPGRVVFASWMTGFGNLLIIDHGRDYLSVYAYNQSTLKQVGDIVGRGEPVARVGATGGQVEPGLYFELRHQGKPINPQVWLGS
ncbi:murein hydrolase activator EnvC family protein [Alcaligenes faecalis]|uniref:murein hydrolase activator EnvC family protein n=1 Tax=Alcaligenes faecalis TaxID=511 RepID=UPI002933A5D3|nr:peptidoglycan DD-metalloendopeptidase family protein [Alcaligenes faecalis]MDV2116302.1 peptidoglycan DD-metalloendopeptidase family protein [Alcaligenes faecalis]